MNHVDCLHSLVESLAFSFRNALPPESPRETGLVAAWRAEIFRAVRQADAIRKDYLAAVRVPREEPSREDPPLLSEEAAALDVTTWPERRGYGCPDGAKCPHCQIVVPPAELGGDAGEMACPACSRRFRFVATAGDGSKCWATLTLPGGA